jgi:hypothetical protein
MILTLCTAVLLGQGSIGVKKVVGHEKVAVGHRGINS